MRSTIEQLADTFEVNAKHGSDQLAKSYDRPDASAGAFNHARMACECFATAETLGANYSECCGELELSQVSSGLIEARKRLDTCAEAQATAARIDCAHRVKRGLKLGLGFLDE